MVELEITREETDSKARYVARMPGTREEAELTLSKVSENLVIADHTGVPDSLRGQGIAAALAERLIADARASGQRIVPLCPFLRAYAQKRRADLQDVIQW